MNLEKRKALASYFRSEWAKSDIEYERWEKRMKCCSLEKYYEGWISDGFYGDNPEERYHFNLIFSTLENKLPSLVITTPKVSLLAHPRVMNGEFDAEAIAKELAIRTDAVNTFFADPDNQLADLQEIALQDSMFRFGVVEIGYSADWYRNPKAIKPKRVGDTEGKKKKKVEVEDLPENERVYIKHVDAKRFRVSYPSKWDTQGNNWVGFYEEHAFLDLWEVPAFQRLYVQLGKEPVTKYSSAFDTNDTVFPDEELIKCLKIYDLRERKCYFVDVSNGLVLTEFDFNRLPLQFIRHSKPQVQHNWYPVPPISQWKTPQDEYNESKGALRSARRRAHTKTLVKATAFANEPELLDKLGSYEDEVLTILTDPSAAVSLSLIHI